MRVTVRLFARLRDLVGAGEVEWRVEKGARVRDVWRELVARFPALAPYGGSVSCAVNADYAKMDAVLSEGDEVAFLPPVSGGGDPPRVGPPEAGPERKIL
jgi:molybdopterin converting factor subunit 1